MVAVRICSLTKAFQKTPVLKGIDLEINAGELFFLLGPSGCGKTTLLRHIAGFLTANSGQIFFGDKEMTQVPAHKRGTAMMFQSYALWPHMSVAENVAFGLKERKLAKTEINARVEEALAMIRMEKLAKRPIAALSGGQQQRVALARSLAVRPDILLLDEPLSNLDARLRLEMRQEIRRLTKEFGLTAIYVTHDQDEALSMADRMAVLDAGVIAQIGTPQEIYRRPTTKTVAHFIGETNFIPGEILSCDADFAEVTTALGTFRAATTSSTQNCTKGTSIFLSVRPESLYFTNQEQVDSSQQTQDKPASLNQFQASIGEATYLGSQASYQLLTGIDSLQKLDLIESNPQQLRAPCNQATTISFHPEDACLIPQT